jgi:hypothetical protein
MEKAHNGEKYNIRFHYDCFFVPIHNIIGKYFGDPQLPSAIIRLDRLTRDGKDIFEQIMSENKVKKSIDELDINSSDPRKIIDEKDKM